MTGFKSIFFLHRTICTRHRFVVIRCPVSHTICLVSGYFFSITWILLFYIEVQCDVLGVKMSFGKQIDSQTHGIRWWFFARCLQFFVPKLNHHFSNMTEPRGKRDFFARMFASNFYKFYEIQNSTASEPYKWFCSICFVLINRSAFLCPVQRADFYLTNREPLRMLVENPFADMFE